MINVNDFMADYKRHREACAVLNDGNKAALCEALAAAGFTSVTVEFDGCGDSGQIESITASKGNDDVPLPLTTVTIRQLSWQAAEPQVTETSLRKAIEILCYGLLEQTHDGWEDNDGAYGDFDIDVAKRTIYLTFTGRFTDTWTDHHSF